MNLSDYLFTCDTSKLDEFVKSIGFCYQIKKNGDTVIYNEKDNSIKFRLFINYDSIYLQDLLTNKKICISHNSDLDSIIKGLKDYFKVTDNKTFELEKILLKADNKFFEKLQEKDFYIIDSGDTKIVLEHSKWKTKMFIIIDSINRVSVVFYNSINACYCVDTKFTWFLGDKDNLCLDDIFNIIVRDDFLIFCQQGVINENEDKSLLETEPKLTPKQEQYIVNELQKEFNRQKTITQQKIIAICDEIADLLVYKNQKYGDSAIHPINIFYKGDTENALLIRLDDKIGRIINNTDGIRVNDVCDTIGYLVLYLVYKNISIEDIQKLKD